jgi:hypothetical protein
LYIPSLPFFVLWAFNIFSATLSVEVHDGKVINIYIIWWLGHYVTKILTEFFFSWSLIRRGENMAGCFHQAFWSSIYIFYFLFLRVHYFLFETINWKISWVFIKFLIR